MIRLLIDKLGDGHKDLFLKIDVMVNHVEIADSYFLFDFLEISEHDYKKLPDGEGARLKFGAKKLIEFWKERIKKVERGQKTFMPFDLSDQCIGGLQLEKVKLGFKTQLVFTDKIVGPEVGIYNLDNLIADREIEFQTLDNNEWLIGEEAIYSGLDWSLKEHS
ncbi:MAG: hypothetical protein O9294_17775 [Cytophagales bacterium]|jgi:hypothetical protein|nr:hypothetical protein [Cytophagales bacterium]